MLVTTESDTSGYFTLDGPFVRSFVRSFVRPSVRSFVRAVRCSLLLLSCLFDRFRLALLRELHTFPSQRRAKLIVCYADCDSNETIGTQRVRNESNRGGDSVACVHASNSALVPKRRRAHALVGGVLAEDKFNNYVV